MSPRTFVTRTAALFALAALGAACETKTIVQPPPTDIVVTVSPQQATLKTAGQQVQFVAQVTGAGTNGNTAVTWKSSNTAVATVSASGNTATVTAVANGVTSIIATSAQDASKSSAATVTVAIDTAAKVVPPTVSINSITNSAGTPADVNNVAGPINIVLNVDVPAGNNVSAVNWLLDGKAFCTQTFTQGKSGDATAQAANAVTMSCQLNTAAVDATGKPLYTNGPHTLSASLVSPTGTVLASTSQQLVFANLSGISVSAAGAKTALDAGGLQWNGGTLTVTVTPSIFTTEVLKTVAVQVNDPVNGLTSTKVITLTSNAPFTVTFPADSAAGSTNGDATEGVQNFEAANTTVTVTSAITAAGQNFSGALGNTTLRYDDKPPQVTVQPTFLINTVTGGTTMWLSLANTFSTSCSGSGVVATFNCQLGSTVTDAGVDVVKATFQLSPNTSTKTWTSVTSFTGMAQAAANTMVSRVQFCDNLGNCSNSSTSSAFGIDLVPPTITAVTNVSGVVTGATISVAAQDTLSGFDLVNGYIQVQITKDSAKSDGSDVKTCYKPGDANTTALPSSGSCAFNTITGTSLTVPPASNPDGYYTVVIQATDIAGNVSTQTSRFFLIDGVAPVVSGVTVTYTTGAATAAVSANVHDNVDLEEYNSRESFAAAFVDAVTSIPFTAPTIVKAFGIPVQGNATGSVTMPVILGIQAAFGSATITNINGLGFSAFDQAMNYGEAFATFATTASTGVTATDVVSSTVAVDNGTICADLTNAACTTTKTSATPTVTLVMNNTVTANPLVTVYFYRVDESGHAVYISQTNAGSLTIQATGANANTRVYTYTASALAATALPSSTGAPAGTNDVFAIGVDKNGNGVLLGQVNIVVQP